MLKVELHNCYILHRRPYRETSLILEVFSSGFGRLSIVARGARRRNDTRRALLEPLRRLQLAWSGRGEMGTLIRVEPDIAPPALDPRRTIAAFYLNELLVRLLHRHESHPELFAAYESALNRLAGTDPEQWTLRIFEKRLLQALGYALVLDRDFRTGERIDPDQAYYYLPDRGPTRDPDSEPDYVRVSGRTLVALQREEFREPDQLDESRRLLRRSLGRHLGTRPLASRNLFRSYLRLNQPG